MHNKMDRPKQQFYGHFIIPSALLTTNNSTDTVALPIQTDHDNEEPLDLSTKANKSKNADYSSKNINKSNFFKNGKYSFPFLSTVSECAPPTKRPKQQSTLNAKQLITLECCLNKEVSNELFIKKPDVFRSKLQVLTQETEATQLMIANYRTVSNAKALNEWMGSKEKQQPQHRHDSVHEVCVQATGDSWRLDNGKSSSRGRQFNCNQCTGSFQTRQNLIRHQNEVHLKIRPYVCSRCGKTFKRTEGLVYHESSVHLRNNRVGCTFPNCSTTFDHKQKLKRHLREIHLQIRPFSCPQCITKFKRKEGLSNHQRVFSHY